MIRVAAVDSSPEIREFMGEAIRSAEDVECVAIGSNGADALDIARTLKPSVMVLALEMPGIGGLEVLRSVMQDRPLRVIIYSSLGNRSLQASLALRLGAFEVLAKPSELDKPDLRAKAGKLLLQRIRAAQDSRLKVAAPDPTVAPMVPPMEDCPFKAIAIGTTSGSTSTLLPLLKSLPSSLPLPVLLFAQINGAMAPGFVELLNNEVGMRVLLAEDGMPVEPGTVYLSLPGRGCQIVDGHWSSLPEYSDDHSSGGLDASLESLANLYGDTLLAMLLGGIGVDGLEGLREIRNRNGVVLLVDPGSTPGVDTPASSLSRGLASETVPLVKLSSRVLALCKIRRG